LNRLLLILILAGIFLPPRIRITTGIPSSAVCAGGIR